MEQERRKRNLWTRELVVKLFIEDRCHHDIVIVVGVILYVWMVKGHVSNDNAKILSKSQLTVATVIVLLAHLPRRQSS